MALLVAAGAGGEQFQLDAGFAIAVINGDALRQLGSALHSRPMAGHGSVLEPSCADLFRASTPSLSGASPTRPRPPHRLPGRGTLPTKTAERQSDDSANAHPYILAAMLNFDGNWRFDSPGEIAPGVIGDFIDLIGRVASQLENRQSVYEHFKQCFAKPANRAYWRSSDLRFAEYDLGQYMETAGSNASLFIEALYDAFEALRQQFSGLAVPDVSRLNRVLYDNEAGWQISPPDLIHRNPHPLVPVPVRAPSFHRQARELFEQSLAESERLLSEERDRLAVQEILWLLETVSTAFRDIDVGDGTVRGKFFNTIVADLRRLEGGDLKIVLEWITALHGYLSSPTGGGVRHGADLAGDINIRPNEARLFCNLTRSYIAYLIAEHERLTGRTSISMP